MKYAHTFTLKSRIQFDNAFLWYLEKSELVGDSFRVAVGIRIEQICENPALYRKAKKQFREAIIKKYPFSIIFTIDEANQLIIITSIFHHKQHPKKKYKR